MQVGSPAPDFTLASDDGQTFSLNTYRKKHPKERIVLVFYPADESPVCTAQLCEYRDQIDEFLGLNATIIGISAQDSKSHQRFKAHRQLPFTLLSDPDLFVAKLYGAKGLLGMKRATFMIDTSGAIRYAHVEATALFRRSAEELVKILAQMDAQS